jgi:hypothetical protein
MERFAAYVGVRKQDSIDCIRHGRGKTTAATNGKTGIKRPGSIAFSLPVSKTNRIKPFIQRRIHVFHRHFLMI